MTMSPSSYFLQSNPLNSKLYSPLHLPTPTHTRPRFSKLSQTLVTFQPQGFAKLNAKCFFFPEKKKDIHLTSNCNSKPNYNFSSRRSDEKNPFFQIIAETNLKALSNALKMLAIAAVFLLMCHPNNPAALAASGGWMGGGSFSSSSSSSSSSSYSVPYSSSTYCQSDHKDNLIFFGVLGLAFLIWLFDSVILFCLETASKMTSVLKLQVGLMGTGRSLQRDLNKIAEVADTSTSEGLTFVLKETTKALLHHPDYFISGYSSVDVKWNIDGAEKRFKQFSTEERGKFDEVTLVNVNNIKRQSTDSQKASGFSSEYIVITILVAAEGVQKLPLINGRGDLNEALEKLAFIPKSEIQAVEVLWTPQKESDTLSEQQLLQDYPLLRPILIENAC